MVGTSSRILTAVVLLVLLASSGVEGSGRGKLRPQDCQPRCTDRCKPTHHKQCIFFCVKCCTHCLCVPEGTDGNKHGCACYTNWKTQEGRPKCP